MAIGFMSISKDVSVHLLNKCFELGPFHGLCVPHPDDVTQPVMSGPRVVQGDDENVDEGNSDLVL